MTSPPPHHRDSTPGTPDGSTAELAPVIATIEELVAGIGRELSAGLSAGSRAAQDGARSGAASLASDLDAAETRIRELREQLWYAQTATQTAIEPSRESSERVHTHLSRYRDLEPLFVRLEAQIRQARLELRLREQRAAAERGPSQSPWQTDAASTEGTAPPTKRPWQYQQWTAAAAALAVALASGWLASRSSRSPTSETGSPAPASLERATANTDLPSPGEPSASPSPTPVGSAPEPGDTASPVANAAGVVDPASLAPSATATSGTRSVSQATSADAGPGLRAASASALEVPAVRIPPSQPVTTPEPVNAPTDSNVPASTPASTPDLTTEQPIRPVQPSDPNPSRLDDVGTRSGVSTAQDPALSAREEADARRSAATASLPVAPTPGTPGSTPAVSAPHEEPIHTLPPVETDRREAPSTTPTPESTPLNRPAAVLTRVQPRMMVEMTSADMTAGVDVRVRVDRSGRATDVRALSGPIALRATAEDTVRRWTFSPALQDGGPIDSELRVTVSFGATPRNLRLPRRSP